MVSLESDGMSVEKKGMCTDIEGTVGSGVLKKQSL